MTLQLCGQSHRTNPLAQNCSSKFIVAVWECLSTSPTFDQGIPSDPSSRTLPHQALGATNQTARALQNALRSFTLWQIRLMECTTSYIEKSLESKTCRKGHNRKPSLRTFVRMFGQSGNLCSVGRHLSKCRHKAEPPGVVQVASSLPMCAILRLKASKQLQRKRIMRKQRKQPGRLFLCRPARSTCFLFVAWLAVWLRIW